MVCFETKLYSLTCDQLHKIRWRMQDRVMRDKVKYTAICKPGNPDCKLGRACHEKILDSSVVWLKSTRAVAIGNTENKEKKNRPFC